MDEISIDKIPTMSKTISVAVPEQFHQVLRERAAHDGLSLSSFLRSALVEKLTRTEKKRKRTG